MREVSIEEVKAKKREIEDKQRSFSENSLKVFKSSENFSVIFEMYKYWNTKGGAYAIGSLSEKADGVLKNVESAKNLFGIVPDTAPSYSITTVDESRIGR